ncbi:S-adenosyl-L-methionine-dependent methyltransferase [Hypoxylon sp. FL1150]|nr:S-adenosyl-L-methionine-dependent methyltransferase [Hypoxylon sp. FL1150]
MPRLPPSFLRHAHSISPYLAALLPVCRDLASARNELRWIREHVADVLSSRAKSHSNKDDRPYTSSPLGHARDRDALLTELCRRRGSGVPLQYILGSQPFGTLDIKCRPGVLIPRPETEAWVTHLADIVRGEAGAGFENEAKISDLRVVDLCLGSGCIALLLHSLLQRRFPGLNVCGYDVDSGAVALARHNLVHNVQRRLLHNPNDSISFLEADIFHSAWLELLLRHGGRDSEKNPMGPVVDILVSNPPYISARGFNRDTARSVRNYEPKRALVPLPVSASACMDGKPEDVFYVRLLEISQVLQPRFAVFEVGDLEQGRRVAEIAFRRFGGARADKKIEIWRDWPDMRPEENEARSIEISGLQVPVKGSGNGRAVFIRRGTT